MTSQNDPLPPRRPITSIWDFAVRAWRPTASWVCVLVLLVNGVVLPVAQLWGVTVQPLSWADLSVFALGLIAAGASRTVEKIQGVTS
jgi:hypothetical protein